MSLSPSWQHSKWQFWIDRGGTFTDVIGIDPKGQVQSTKILSENPQHYADAAVEGIRQLMDLEKHQTIEKGSIDSIKMGTTLATNALLQHKGQKTLLCISQGFADLLEIGYQNRPDLFALNIQKPKQLYRAVMEAEERLDHTGQILTPINLSKTKQHLKHYYRQGFRAIAIALMHAHQNPQHERLIASQALQIGFTQVSVSHQISALPRFIARANTTVVDAYLSPIVKNYIQRFEQTIGSALVKPLRLMRSDGGLSLAAFLQGKDAILSGPAGGVVGMVKVCQQAGFSQLIGFDMGGTSSDVCHYHGDYQRSSETTIAGVHLQLPMMKVHSVAAGGGSLLKFEDGRFSIGPESAGADPGPACYGRGGPLTITDCNLLLGRLSADHFPKVFGQDQQQPLNQTILKDQFRRLQRRINDYLKTQQQPLMSIEEIAWGYIKVAVTNMANAIKKIAVEQGTDIRNYTLCCFGGAAGQHACLIASELNIKTIIMHPLNSLLSALGIGLAGISTIQQKSIDRPLNQYHYQQDLQQLQQQAQEDLQRQGVDIHQAHSKANLLLRYNNSETTLLIEAAEPATMQSDFERQHLKLFGFIQNQAEIMVDRIQLEMIEQQIQTPPLVSADESNTNTSFKQSYYQDGWRPITILSDRNQISRGGSKKNLQEQWMVIDATSTLLIDPGWQVVTDDYANLILERSHTTSLNYQLNSQQADPVLLEIFNNRLVAIAEEMGATLANTAQSVNIRERLDFSCALFNHQAQLIANANHIPVHLGSMHDSVYQLITDPSITLQDGDVYLLNNPFKGGTHLPDITVITPMFSIDKRRILFYLASRAHHADIGGTVPGSCPAQSTNLHQEGVIINNFQVIKANQFLQQELEQLLLNAPYPCRNVAENIADIKAQIAANAKGVKALRVLLEQYPEEGVLAYTQFVQDNAEKIIKQSLSQKHSGHFVYELDNAKKIVVNIDIDTKQQTATIDFEGTSPQHTGNFNAPASICKAAVLYVLRCLSNKNIPLNQGCLKPITIKIPEGSFINARYPAAVVAGNTEVSQAIVECLLAALGMLAGSQGTMNNLTYGNDHYQNYETLCGGAGAGINFDGASAVHTHMTNTRMTDPEVLERRYPVRVIEFSIRKNTAGKGQYRGGEGVKREILFNQAMHINVISSNRNKPPHGLLGGEPGALGKNQIRTASGKLIDLNGNDQYAAKAGDCFIMLTPSGGGYGKACAHPVWLNSIR